MVLLAALAGLQYRWSTRVAAADAQREREHLDSAAALFASEFDVIAGQAVEFLDNDARTALESGTPLAAVPKLIGELYYLEIPRQGAAKARRLTAGGLFTPFAAPSWAAVPGCPAGGVEQPLTLVAPVYDVATERGDEFGTHILNTFHWRPGRCFVARIDQAYLRHTLFPRLIRQSFGETAVEEYDFAVLPRSQPRQALYGSPLNADLRKPFFVRQPVFALSKALAAGPPGVRRMQIRVQHLDAAGKGLPAPDAGLFDEGRWELEVAHKGVPLAAAFEQTRRRDLLGSVAIEALLAAAIVFLVIAARRTQRLADQKMQFIAGVSHELRSPVSAIAMLSRNQADGLVAGTERVKQYGELMHHESRRLNEMVEQTLQYAGIHSARRLVKNEVDLRGLIQQAVDARREELARGGFEVEIVLDADLPAISGDAHLLGIAFDNLLSNAEKHAGRGHWIRVSGCYWAPEKEVRIGVEDRGEGIDPADQAEIFEPFYRGRAAVESQIPGSGLGLSLVRSAAEVHRGTVTLVSEPGRGSTFTLHLPV
jgi:signal transduction histidine kinase